MQCGSSEDLMRLHREASTVINEKYRFSKYKLYVSRHLLLAQRMNGKLTEIRIGVLIRLFVISYSILHCQPTRSLWLGQNCPKFSQWEKGKQTAKPGTNLNLLKV